MSKKKKDKKCDFRDLATETLDPAEETAIHIDRSVYQKIMHWVNKSDFEVSGLGKVILENGVLRVTEAILLPQTNTHTTTEIEPQDMGKAMFLLKDTPGMLNFWWHSHVNMDVFWSIEDLNTIKKLGAGGWFLSSVFNKKNEVKSSIYFKNPIEFFIGDIETFILENVNEDLVKDWDEQYKVNVKNETYTTLLGNYRKGNKKDILDNIPYYRDDDYNFETNFKTPELDHFSGLRGARKGPPASKKGSTGGVY